MTPPPTTPLLPPIAGGAAAVDVISPLKAPMPYFGGKSTVASVVWERLGDVPNYCEPFFGSGAMLLSRPAEHLQRNRTETVNDKDGMVSNFWRAMKYNPQGVAEYADWPVNENDLHARHAWLVGQRDSLIARLEGYPEYFDAKIAGYWVWGMSCWIGGGFCDGSGPWRIVNGELVNVRNGGAAGGSAGRPQLHNEMGVNRDSLRGRGVVQQLPYLRSDQGVSKKRPHLLSEKGITRQAPRLSGDQGVVRQMPEPDHSSGLYDYFDQLQARLRRVRVCSGDWSRIMGPSVTVGNGLTGVFLDPPYVHAGRDTDLYAEDQASLAHETRLWAIANGNNPLFRIAYCGYEDGFAWPADWMAHHWSTNGGYANQGDQSSQGKANKHREVVWFSPHCIQPKAAPMQLSLFEIAV